MSVPRKPLPRSVNSAAAPTPIPEAEIIDWIYHVPFGGERWFTAIDSVVRIFDAAEAKDTDTLRKLSNRSKGGKLPKRLAALAVAFLEQDDVRGAATGPERTLKGLFEFSRQYSFGWNVWMAESRRRIAEPSQSAALSEASHIEVSLEDMIETINMVGESNGPRIQLVALCGYREFISPELATAMMKLAYDTLGLPPELLKLGSSEIECSNLNAR